MIRFDTMTFEFLFRDIRHSVRGLLRRPGFALLALLTLGLGIGANTAIFSVVNAVLIRPLPYPDPEAIVALWETDGARGWNQAPVSAEDYLAWRDQLEGVEVMAAGRPQSYSVTGGGDPEQIPGIAVGAEFFEVFRTPPAMGRGFDPSENSAGNHRVAILSHGLWERRWGSDPDVLGTTMEVGGEMYEVIGVMPEGFAFPSTAQMWTPLVISDGELADVNRHFLYVFGRLAEGRSVEAADRELKRIAELRAVDFPDSNRGWGAVVLSMHEQMTQNVRSILWVLLGAVGFVLLIACGNVANLLLVRASGRAREMSVRAALGAGKGRLVRQLLTESAVLAAAGTVVGLFFAWVGLDLLLSLSPITVPGGGEVGIDLGVLGFAAGAAALSGLLFGSVPAWSVWRSDLNRGLRDGGRGGLGTAGRRTRATLVMAEMAMALVLVTGAGLMLQSVTRLLDQDVGMNVENVVTAGFNLPQSRYPSPDERRIFYETLMERAERIPGVTGVALTPWLPPGGGPLYHVRIEGVHEAWTADLPLARMRTVTPGFFQMMEIPLLQGRTFTPQDDANADLVAIVDQAFVDTHFPGEDPIGRQFRTLQDVPRTIVGVVGNVANAGLANQSGPTDYLPHDQMGMGFGQTLVVKTSTPPEDNIAAVREAIWELDGNLPLTGVGTLASRLDQSVASQRFNATLLTLFAALALILAGVGIYGVMAYTVREQTRELGLRMALGASRGAVQTLVLKRAMLLVAGGVGAGLLASFGLTRVISGFLFGVSATDPLTITSVVVLLAAVGVVASWIPAHRASRLDPQVALRQD